MSIADALFQYGFMRRSGLLRLLQKTGLIKAAEHSPEQFSEAIFGNHLVDARLKYRLKPYAGDVLQFRASTARDGRLFDRGFGWDRWVAGRYDVIDVPSDHFNMMREPAASTIGKYVAERLEEIEAKAARK